MIVASIQLGIVQGDKKANQETALANIARCADCDLVILPEIWNLGFRDFAAYEPQAERRDGPTLSALRRAAREAKVFLHTGSFVELDGDKLFNSSYLVSPEGELLANYRKVHLFGHQSQETALLTPGREFTVVDTPLGRLGLATCYDLRFPEQFRAMAEQGAQLFLVCSAWALSRLEPWRLFNRVRALENQCFLISANSCGPQLGDSFAGHSMMVDPWGTALAEAGEEESILKAELDLGEVARARKEFPAFSDRVAGLS